MKIIEYKIQSLIYVKAEITKLVPLPIKNVSDNYYIIIPIIMSALPDNVMFIQETLLVAPHSSANYIPKIVKLGITLSQSIATKLPKGIDIKLLVIDNINSIGSVNSIVKKDNVNQTRDVNINHNNQLISDGTIVKVDQQRKELLNTIDDIVTKNELLTTDNISSNNNNSLKPIIKEVELPVEKQYTLNNNNSEVNNNEFNQLNNEEEEYNSFDDNENVILDDDNEEDIIIKRGRGRPRKYPISEAQKEFQNLLLSNDE